MRLVNWRALVVGAAGFGLAACGDDVTIPNVTQTVTYTTNPSAVNCTTGQATAVGINVSGATSAPTITFTPTAGIITGTGTTSGSTFTFTCSNTAGAGSIGFSFTSNGQTFNGSIPVTVAQGGTGGNTASAIAITINPTAASIVPGGSQIFTASVTLANGAPATTSTAATFASSDTTIARVVNNANGTATVTVVNSTANTAGRQAVITATSVANTNLRAQATVTVAAGSALVSGLVVNPTNISLTSGGTQQVTPQVTLAPGAPAGTSTGVTYISSDTSIARVSSTGLITAGSRAGTAVITVASVAAPGVSQQVSVTVGVPAPVRLTIQSIRVVNGGAAGGTQPADLNNVAGNLFVTLNLDPGDFRPDSVRLRLGASTTICQRFTAQLAEAYRLAMTTGSADVQPIECQLNTSAFNARLDANGNLVAIDPTRPIGAAGVLNGTQNLVAEVFYRPAGSAAGTGQSQQASISQPITLNNTTGFFVNVSNTPSAAQAAINATGQATGPQGVLWRAGTVTVTALPVNFVSNTSATGSQNLTLSLSDFVNGTIATRSVAVDANNATFTATFSGTTAAAFAADGSLDGYTSPNAGVAQAFNPANPATTAGTFVVVGTAVGTTNTAILNAAGQPAGFQGNFGNTASTAIFIDNQSPQPAVNFLPTAQANFIVTGAGATGFINGAFPFAQGFQPQFVAFSPTGLLPGALIPSPSGVGFVPAGATTTFNADYNGVDRVTTAFFASNVASTSATTITAAANAVTTGGTVRPLATGLVQTPTTNTAAARFTDALGNVRNQVIQVNIALNASGTGIAAASGLTFGVDLLAPVLQSVGNSTGVIAQTGGQTFAVQGQDDVGFGLNPYLISITRVRRSENVTTPAALTTECYVELGQFGAGANGAFGFVSLANTIGAATCPTVTNSTNAIGLSPASTGSFIIPNTSGQYTFTAQVRDQGGNLSNSVTSQAYIDITNPIVTGVGIPQVLTGGTSATFPIGAQDNLELGGVSGLVQYANLASLIYPETVLGTAFDNVFTAVNASIPYVIPSFIRSLTNVPGASYQSGNPVPGNTAQYASSFFASVRDVTGRVAPFTGAAIPTANIQGAAASLPTQPFVTASPTSNIFGFSLGVVTNSTTTPQTLGGAITISGGGTAGVPTAATLQVISTGALNQFFSPFSRVELYVQVGVPAAPAPQLNTYRLFATVAPGFVSDAGAVRLITSSFTVTANSTFAAPTAGSNVYNVIAVGVNANGDGLVANPVTITVVP